MERGEVRLFKPKEILDGRAFQRDPLSFLQQIQERGSVIFFRVGFTEFALVRSAELVARILSRDNDLYGEGKWTIRGKFVMGDCMITREGELHVERRKCVQPAFAKSELAAARPVILKRAHLLSERWSQGTFDVYPDLAALALEIVGESLFSVDLTESAIELNRALSKLLSALPRLPIPKPSLLAAKRKAHAAARELSEGRLLSCLREAGLSPRQISDEIVSLLIASVDTTPRTLAWIFVLLSLNPEWEERVLDEIQSVCGDQPVEAEQAGRFETLDLVIQETLRLYPPVQFIDRRPLQDVELDGTRVKAGTYLLLCPLLTQRDPEHFHDPSAFIPERWTQEETRKRHRFSFFPFGAGPHVCIGRNLAMDELRLTAVALLQRWRLQPGTEIVKNMRPQRMRFPMTVSSR